MRILVATDGSECSYQAVRQLLTLVHHTHHYIKALYVMPLLTIGRNVAYLENELEAEGMTALSTVRAIFSQAAIEIEAEIRQGIPADTILEVARNGKYDLIVMGHRGRGGFREMLLGSVSKTITRNAPCSVLIGR